jgi:TolB protein
MSHDHPLTGQGPNRPPARRGGRIPRSILALGILLSAARPGQGRDALYLELSGRGQRLNLGLAEFSAVKRGEGAEPADAMREVVKSDLLFPRIFNIIEGGEPPRGRKVPFESWAERRADVLVSGTYNPGKYGRFEFVGLLHDVAARQIILEKKYMAEFGQERRVAHQWADEVVRHFLGQSGVAQTSIYFVNDATGKKEICAVDYDGQNFRRLTNDRSISLLPKVSPDGQWIAYVSYRDGVPNLYLLSTDGTRRKLLCRYEGLNSAAAWLPDGRSLVATLSMGRDPNLYLVDTQGEVIRALTNSRSVDTAPTLSPDGRHLAFTSDRVGYPQIFTMDLNGANLRRMTRSGECDSPAWSPQGNLVAFAMSEFGGQFDIYTMEVGSGSLQRLTYGTGSNENPSWSPDGRYIAFTTTRRGRSELWVMGVDGSNPQPVGQIPGNSVSPHWGP